MVNFFPKRLSFKQPWSSGFELSLLEMHLAHVLNPLIVKRLLVPDNERLLADYGVPFVAAWKITHNYRVWYSNKHPAMAAITPGWVETYYYYYYHYECDSLKKYSFNKYRNGLKRGENAATETILMADIIIVTFVVVDSSDLLEIIMF